jgi:hypothetical protein
MPMRIQRFIVPAALVAAAVGVSGCGAPDADGMRETARAMADSAATAADRADSLQEVVARLRRELNAARAAARQAVDTAPASVEPAANGEASERVLADATPADRREADVRRMLLRFRGDNNVEISYIGEIRDGKANGIGYGVWSTGSSYEGEWRDNQRNGPGKHRYPDGARYEGMYVNDRREGDGTYFYKNGQKWIGPWKDNLRHGTGILYEANGKVRVQGVWEKDRLVREIKP